MDREDMGVAGSSAGRSAAPSGLSLASESQAKPAATNAAEYVVFDNGSSWGSRYDVRRVARVTDKLVKLERGGYPSQISREKVVAFCDGPEVAALICQTAAGIDGEYRRRERLAKGDYNSRVTSALAAKKKALAALAAASVDGSPKGGDGEAGSIAEGDDSAVGEAETPIPSDPPQNREGE